MYNYVTTRADFWALLLSPTKIYEMTDIKVHDQLQVPVRLLLVPLKPAEGGW